MDLVISNARLATMVAGTPYAEAPGSAIAFRGGRIAWIGDAPAAVVRHFGLRAVRLMSNNPEKIQALEKAGVLVAERVPSIVDPVESTLGYLRTKREKLGHLLDR